MAAKVPYRPEELRRTGKQRSFSGEALGQIAFPLGGIGTGTVSLGGRGNLRDWEIHNRPGKNKNLPLTFFAVWAKTAGSKDAPVAKILERKLLPPYHAGHGLDRANLGGVARFDEAEFRGEYPFAWIDFKDRELPVKASLEAYTPFVPLNADESSYPVAVFHWTFRNPSKKAVQVSLLSTMQNPIGRQDIGVKSEIKSLLNQYRKGEGVHGLWFTAPELKADDPNQMTAALTTTWEDADVQTNLYKGGWWDSAHILWDDFAEDGRLEESIRSVYGDEKPKGDAQHAQGFFDFVQGKGGAGTGALCMHATIEPGASVTIPVTISWHSPFMKAWTENIIVRTYMASQFKDAWDAAELLQRNKEGLEAATRAWHGAFYGSTLPAVALDAAGSQASIIRTPTCVRLADGQFYGWEGCSDDNGCCNGTCTHVWNYEQALAFLFPALERSIRKNEFLNSTDARGHMQFRSSMPANAKRGDYHACGDGQMGCIIRLYRDWQLSGDDRFLKECWPAAKRALEFAWTEPNGWDADGDGLMEGCQHNTYDIEFYGPNPLMQAMYLGALEAGARMAGYLGDEASAKAYRKLAASGRKKMEKDLWNGDYYIQKVNVAKGLNVPEHLRGPAASGSAACGPGCDCNQPPGGKAPALVPGKDFEVKYQHGEGCLADQLLGQWASHVAGLGYVLDPEQVERAVATVFKHNFLKEIGAFNNVQRIYALNDEAGLLLCSWPGGNRPRLPFVYSDEVWTGIEYQVAAHLIYEGRVDEGLAVTKGVRDRYDGLRRNPWNEFECGHHYARAMASWSLVTALGGFSYSAVEGRIGFAPKVNAENFRSFFSLDAGWGVYAQKSSAKKFSASIEAGYGRVELKALDLAPPKTLAGKAPRASVNGKAVGASAEATDAGVRVTLETPVALNAGEKLDVVFG
ncbi:MAG: hypothetical protein KIS92_18070 [Planctomycetota bacterium]|nr:hypothetical protein [Planctomycetota bacterium]